MGDSNQQFGSDTDPNTERAESRDGEGSPSSTRRRVLLSGAATWATVGLAGCSDNGGQGTATTTGTSSGTATETAQPQPENYVVTAETGAGSEGVPEGASFVSSCAASTRFVPGMQVVFYVGIYDPETGDQLTDEDLESAVVNIDGGETVELGWAGDDEENPAQEWAGSYVLPEDASTGTMSYSVEVTDGNANFRSVGILEDSFEVIEYSDPTNYVVTTETIWNGHPAPEYTNNFVGSCGVERQFSTEMDVTFHIGIYDSTTSDFVGNDTIDSVTIESTDGSFDSIDLEYFSGEEENSSERWAGALETENLDTGTYRYEISVSDSEYTNVGISENQFTIVEIQS